MSFAFSSRFEQFGAFTYGLKACRQLSIVLRCLMKQQCVCRCTFSVIASLSCRAHSW
ncbi:DUF3709 domain-containing protein [Vibrio paracholerae]|nr:MULTISPECIES: DUF3709 domain-containing protein [Vibrio]QAV06755.1 thiol:disulfide interchange protein DsbD [Vibrio cholerae]WOQ99467.1 DUF3709 domain-containing protein [Vibrio paracholerae]